jgi:hypothetical protein
MGEEGLDLEKKAKDMIDYIIFHHGQGHYKLISDFVLSELKINYHHAYDEGYKDGYNNV